MHRWGWLVLLTVILAVRILIVVPTFARPVTTIPVTTFTDSTADDGVCSLRDSFAYRHDSCAGKPLSPADWSAVILDKKRDRLVPVSLFISSFHLGVTQLKVERW
jgi:hypothetical protein